VIPVWLLPDRVIGGQAAARPALARIARPDSKAGAAINYRPDIDGLRGVAASSASMYFSSFPAI
jgi:hypothetical protein